MRWRKYVKFFSVIIFNIVNIERYKYINKGYLESLIIFQSVKEPEIKKFKNGESWRYKNERIK
jgi:hypothetical protein